MSIIPIFNIPNLQYGDSFFILNNDTVRSRTTIADGDTANPKRAVGTFSACHHVLNRFSDIELNNIYKRINPEADEKSSYNTDSESVDSLISMRDDWTASKVPWSEDENEEEDESDMFTLKEVQVHGLLRFKEDFKALVVSRRHTTENLFKSDTSKKQDKLLLQKARKFCNVYDIELRLQHK